jgi:glycosyltransferase-like protein
MAERLRVAMFTYSTHPRGGVVHALEVAEALQARGHDVVLHAIDDGAAARIRTPLCRYVLVPVERRTESTLAFVRRRVDAYVAALQRPSAGAFDVYHAQDGISGNALATLTERGALPGFVRTVHHIDDFADSELAALQDRAIVRANACFAVSDVWRERLRERYGIQAGLAPNGVDSERFVPVAELRRAAIRKRLGFANGPLFVAIGGIEARKNTLATLESFALVRKAEPRSRLAIVGGASVFDHSAYRRAFEMRARELGLELGADVVMTGALGDEEVVAYLQAATALVFPSLVEGFGLVVLEALACGTPVVTSAIRPFTDYLTSDSAFLVDPHDARAIAGAMLATIELHVRARLAGNGLPLAARYSWNVSAHAHAALYRDSLRVGDAAVA